MPLPKTPFTKEDGGFFQRVQKRITGAQQTAAEAKRKLGVTGAQESVAEARRKAKKKLGVKEPVKRKYGKKVKDGEES